MNEILGDSLSNYRMEKVQWCYDYINDMRATTREKFDQVSAYLLEYIEDHIRYTEQELKELKS
jgi:hypothetical protein